MNGVAWGLCGGRGEGMSVKMVVVPERVLCGRGVESRSEREAGGGVRGCVTKSIRTLMNPGTRHRRPNGAPMLGN